MENIKTEQKGQFPVLALEGVSHMSFMSGKPPGAVKKRDLRAQVTMEEGHNMIATHMFSFFKRLHEQTPFHEEDYADSSKVLEPLLNAMKQEGYYRMKPPCYDTELVNRITDPTCQHGAPWNSHISQKVMGGDIPEHITINTDDNFHRVYSILPVHLPQINNTCNSSSTENCTLETITVSQNHYGLLDKFDTGYYPVSASEMKVKLVSRQNIQNAIMANNTDFHQLDEEGNRCKDINDEAIVWAGEQISSAGADNYEKYGIKYRTGEDMGPYNEGPLWIWHFMNYTEDLEG